MWKFYVFASCVFPLIVTHNCDGALVTFTTQESPFSPPFKNLGWWSDTVPNSNNNVNYFVGDSFGRYRNFFTFDLSRLGPTDTITSATLRLTRFQSSNFNEAFETYELFDVSTDAATLNNNTGANASIFQDLGSGVSYGAFQVPGFGPFASILNFSLNFSAIPDLNAARGGFFSIGGDLTSSPPGSRDGLFLASGGGIQHLVLNVEPTVIPEPSVLASFSIGCATLLLFYTGFTMRCQKKSSHLFKLLFR